MKSSFFLLPFASVCRAWSFTGHEMIASVASDLLSPSAATQINEILDGRPLSSIAAWADTIKWQQRYKFTSPLHYINSDHDDPPKSCAFSWHAPGHQELIAAIHNYTTILRHAEVGTWRESEALRFLVHFVEDLHQPLHLSGRARGGNDVYVHFDGYRTNLHRIWDGLGLMKRMRAVSANASSLRTAETLRYPPKNNLEQMMADYHEYINNLLQTDHYHARIKTWLACPSTVHDSQYGCPESWALDVAPLNCEYTWVDVKDGVTLPPSYWARIEDDMVIEELVMRAALRLAAVLNSVFAYREEAGVASASASVQHRISL